MTATVRIPVYTFGKYRAQDGTYEEFTDEKMRQLVKNTNFVIQSKAFIPTFGYVGYDHPVFGKVTDTNAHGHIKAAHYQDGVVSLDVLPIADTTGRARLIEDAKAGRRPHVSGEHSNSFSFADGSGKTVHVGPTILGLAALGSERPAIKNPKIVPLSEIEFPESVTAADAFTARETLRKTGLVAQHFSEGVLVFSEVQLSTDVDEQPKEQPMTAEDRAEMQRMMDAQKATLEAAFQSQIAALKDEHKQQIVALSEGAENKRKVLSFCETIATEKKLPKTAADRLQEAMLNPTQETLRAFAESLPAIVLYGRRQDGDTPPAEGDEPAALAAVRPKHFSDRQTHGTLLAEGMISFAEFKPERVKGLEKNPTAQFDAFRAYVVERDTAATA